MDEGGVFGGRNESMMRLLACANMDLTLAVHRLDEAIGEDHDNGRLNAFIDKVLEVISCINDEQRTLRSNHNIEILDEGFSD